MLDSSFSYTCIIQVLALSTIWVQGWNMVNFNSVFLFYFIFSSPEPKAHRWAYSIGRHPSFVRPSSSTTSPLKPWSRFLQNFTHSIYRPGERKVVFFCSNQLRTLFVMATYSSHWLIMGKVETGFYCCLTADIWQKFYRNVPWVVLYETYEFCPNRWIWLVAMATGRLHLRKKIFKNHLLRSHKGDEVETLQKCS